MLYPGFTSIIASILVFLHGGVNVSVQYNGGVSPRYCNVDPICVCVCVFIKLHITAQSGLVILVTLCHSR